MQVEFLWPAGTPPPVEPQARYVCELNHEWTARVLYGLPDAARAGGEA